MHDFCFTIPYGLLLVCGGVIGYAKKGSTASLAGGIGTGSLLVLAGYLSLQAFHKRKNSYFALILETGLRKMVGENRFPTMCFSVKRKCRLVKMAKKIVCPYFNVVAPPEIWEMRQLRHVRFCSIYLPDPPLSDRQDDSVVLWNLQMLVGVMNLTLSDEVCKRIRNVNCLGIQINYDAMSEKSPYDDFCLWNFARFRKLDSLSYESKILGTGREVDLVQNVAFLTSLRTLFLIDVNLGSEDLKILGSLTALVYFTLSEISFTGYVWRGEFLGLKRLVIAHCCGLRQWSSTEEDSYLPVLESLYLFRASELDELPLTIGENTLRSITMSTCSLSANISAAKILEERMSLGNDGDLVVEIEFWDRAEKDTFLAEITEFECLGSDKLIISSTTLTTSNDQDAAEESETD